MELSTDVLIAGAGCGGVAAALSAARLGRRVILTEPTDWIGGQLTAQAVPPDEHPWVETTGATATYRQMRDAVRERFRSQPGVTPAARRLVRINPGDGWVSTLCAEPPLIHTVLLEMLAAFRANGQLRLFTNYEPTKVQVAGDLIMAVEFTSTKGEDSLTVQAAYVLDATEEGDLLPLSGCEHVIGAESRQETGEPHALDGPANPVDQQAITWCAALEWCPGEDHTTARPADYGFWASYQAPFWPGPQLGWVTQDPETGEPLSRPLFGVDSQKDLWRFRRIRRGDRFRPPLADVTLVNWPQVDYWLLPVTGESEDLRDQRLEAARGLTLSFIYWLQHYAPRPDGGTGYPGLRLSGDALGTEDGLAAAPYIRESRRIRAEFTVREQHIGVGARAGFKGAEPFPDSVGVGSYRIDRDCILDTGRAIIYLCPVNDIPDPEASAVPAGSPASSGADAPLAGRRAAPARRKSSRGRASASSRAPMSLAVDLCDLMDTFGTDERCREALEGLRWPGGPRCPRCQSDKLSRMYKRDQFDCDSCGYQFSVTAGTIFHDTHLPLRKWFLAVYVMTESRKGVSANQLKRMLGVSYKTAWYLCHRIRAAMAEANPAPLTGTVETDETFLGGKLRRKAGEPRLDSSLDHQELRERRREAGREWHKHRTIVLGAVERGGRVRLQVAPHNRKGNVMTFLESAVDDHATAIYSDELRSYDGLGDEDTIHATVNHAAGDWVRGDVHTNTIESVWSLLDRAIMGSYHRLSVKHLPAYLSEFEWRFNNRENAYLFRDTLMRLLAADPLQYKSLIA